MAASATTTSYTRVDALVKVEVESKVDAQGRRELSFTEADAKSLLYALADVLGYEVASS